MHHDFGSFIGSFGHLPFFLQAHTSSVSHLDWSKDGEKLQSTSTDYELLFCKGKLYFDPAYKYTIVVKENTCHPSVYFFFSFLRGRLARWADHRISESAQYRMGRTQLRFGLPSHWWVTKSMYSKKSERVKLFAAILRAFVLSCFSCDLCHNINNVDDVYDDEQYILRWWTNGSHGDMNTSSKF